MKSLYKKIREVYRIKFGRKAGVEFEADLLGDSISADIRAWCFNGQRHLKGDHPAYNSFNRILFYISRPEYVDFIQEKRDDRKKNRDVQEDGAVQDSAER